MKEYLENQLIFEVDEEDVLEVREGLEHGQIGGIEQRTLIVKDNQMKINKTRGVFRGWGAMGAKPLPGPVKSIDFRGFSGPNEC